MSRISFIFLTVLIVLAGCTRKTGNLSAEQVLEAYVTLAMTARSVSDKKDLVNFTTGAARESLVAMSDDDFQKEFIDKKFKLIKFATKDKRVKNENELSLVYQITFEKTENEKPARVTLKKIAFFAKAENGGWKINKTNHIRTAVKRADPVDVRVIE